MALFSTREAGQVVVDLAGVELSQREGVDLLDRSRIEQVLAEQKLTALGDKSDPLLLGQLLGVEMFIVWDQPGAKPEGRLIVFDGATGVRLDDRQLADKDTALIAQTLATHVDAALKKQTLVRESQLRLISLTSLRNVNLPPQLQERADQFLSQLEQSITQHPNCGLLERARLRYVVREKSLPIAQKQAHLLGAAHTITVELSQSGANQWTVKLLVNQAGQAQPLAFEEKLKLDNGADDSQSIAALTEKLSQLNVEDASRLTTEQRRQLEIATLKSDGQRLMITRHHLEAATRFEAAYALGEVSNYVLSPLLIVLDQSIRNMSLSYARVGSLPIGNASASTVPPERWFEIADLAHYRLDVMERLHQYWQQGKDWPFRTDSPSSLTQDFDLSDIQIPVQALTDVDPEKLPAQYAALQAVYRRSNDYMFQKLAGRASRRLQGEELQRFNQQLSANQLFLLAGRSAQHLEPNWADRFVEVFTENLQHEKWLIRIRFIAPAVRSLPAPQRALLLSRLEALDSLRFPVGGLGAQYIQVILLATEGSERPPGFDADCVALAEQLLTEFAKPEDAGHHMMQFGIHDCILQVPARRWALSDMLDETLKLVSNRDLEKTTREDMFLRMLRQDLIEPHLLSYVSFHKRTESLETLQQALDILERKDPSTPGPWKEVASAIRKSVKSAQAPPLNVPFESQHLAFPWKSVQEVRLADPGKLPRTLHATGIHKGLLYIITSREEPRSDVVALQIHRQSLMTNTPVERLVEYDVPRDRFNAESQRVADLLKQPHVQPFFFSHWAATTVLGFTDKYLVMPTLADGVYAFPLGGGPPIRFGVEQGLSSNFVQCAMPLGDQVYAWVGVTGTEANFVAIDLASSKVQLLASCQRQQQLTPLDNMNGAKFGFIPPPPHSKHLVMSVVGAVRDFNLPPDSRNGLWEFSVAESLLTQIPLPSGDRRFPFSLATSDTDVRAIRRYEFQTQRTQWFQFDPTTRKSIEIPSTQLRNGCQPIWLSESANWWRLPHSSIGYRQHPTTGHITEFRVAVEGNTGVDKVQFYQNENTAIIQSGTRVWIVRGFQQKPE